MVDDQQCSPQRSTPRAVPSGFVVAGVAAIVALTVIVTSTLANSGENAATGRNPDDRSTSDVQGSTRWRVPTTETPCVGGTCPGSASEPPAADPLIAEQTPVLAPLRDPATTEPAQLPTAQPPTALPPTAAGPTTRAPQIRSSTVPRSPADSGAPWEPVSGFPDESPPPPADMISAWLDAPTTVVSGTATSATVLVHNGSGRELVFSGCSAPYGIDLSSPSYSGVSMRPSCIQRFRLPVGTSRWPVRIDASYPMCTSMPTADTGQVACTTAPDGTTTPPGVPAGSYSAVAVAVATGWLPPTPPVPIEVLPAGSA